MMPEMQCRDLVKDEFSLMLIAIESGKNKPSNPRESHVFTQLVNSLSQLICVTDKFTFAFRFLPVCYLPAQMKMYNIVLLLILGSCGG